MGNHAAASKPSVGVGRSSKLRGFVVVNGRRLFRRLNAFLASQSICPDTAILGKAAFPFVSLLEEHHAEIRKELDQVLAARHSLPSFHHISPDQKRISRGDKWKAFVLCGFGERSERNCRQCPNTAALLEAIPGLQSAWFSIISPGYKIPRHRGVTKGVLRVHLALKVPRERERCYMIVDAETVSWEEGRCIVFDDTRHHEVCNDTDEERVVLLVDFDRPMRLGGRLLHRLMIGLLKLSPYFRDARRNQMKWEDTFEASVSRIERAVN